MAQCFCSGHHKKAVQRGLSRQLVRFARVMRCAERIPASCTLMCSSRTNPKSSDAFAAHPEQPALEYPQGTAILEAFDRLKAAYRL